MTGFRMMVAGLAAGLVLVAAQAHAADYKLRLHTLVKSPHPYNDMADYMKTELAAKSGGKIEVQIFDAGQLGQDPAVLGEMGLGTIDLIVSSTSNAVKQVPEFQVFSMPYLFTSLDDVMARVGPGSKAEAYFQKVYADRKLGIQLLALGVAGARNMANSEKPVNALADISGMKMRTPPSALMSKSWAALGTIPVQIAWGELYAAVQTGVAQGLEASLPGYSGAKLYEVAPYLAMTGHEMQVDHISISDRAWKKLPADLQALMLKTAQEAAVIGKVKADQYDAELVEELKAKYKVTVTTPDVGQFQAALKSLQVELAQELKLTDALASLQ